MKTKVLILASILSISSFSIFTKKSEDINVSSEPEIISKFERNNSSNKEYLDTDIEDTPYDENNINFTLYVQTSSEIENTNVINDGMVLNNSIDFNDNHEATMNYTVTSEKASTTIEVNLSNSSNTLSLSIYSYKTEYGIFLNAESLELAEDNYYSYLLYNEYITEDEYANYVNPTSSPSIEKDEETIENVENTNNPKIKGRKKTTTFLEGTLSWIDDENKISHPLSGILVKIYDKDLIGNQYLGSTYTNENGFYSFSFQNRTLFENGGYDIFIRVYSQSEKTNVVKSLFFNNSYFVESEVTKNVTTGNYYDKSMTINMDTNAGKAIQIAQALSIGNEYVKAMNGTSAPSVSAKYPASGSYQNYFGIHYEKEDYKFWDILLHEYGHHLQEWMGITSSPGGDHYINGDCIELRGKSKGIKLAWGEAWPTVFALQVTDYFSYRLKDIKYISDTKYDSSGDDDPWYFDLETPNINYGEGCEGTIMAVLYDLYDERNESFDQIALGHQALWNIMKTCKSKTFSQFANYIYENSVIDKNLFGKLLSKYGMAARDLFITQTDSFSKIPSFKWTEGGNYNSSASKSNKFNLEFYDYYGNIILTTTDLFNNFYTPSSDEWNKIINAPGNMYYISIKTYQTSKPATGVYYSEYYTFTKPNYDKNRYILYPSAYQYTESYGDTTTRPININDLVITTERKRCGFIEGEYINLSPRKQGQGEAYISYHLNKTIYKVEVNLSLWGKSEYLEVLQSKIAIQTLDEFGKYQDKYLVDINSLPTDRTCPNLYTFPFEYGITDFRIYVKTAPIGTANKGRVSIGNMSLYY